MDLYEAIDHVQVLLQKYGQMTYRALKLRFKLDDNYLEALKEELIDARHVAVDENGRVLVWTGTRVNGETDKRINGEKAIVSSQASVFSPQPPAPNPQPPKRSGRVFSQSD